MKKTIFIFLIFFFSKTLFAQNISGAAIYKKEVYNSFLNDGKSETKLSKLMKEMNDNLDEVEYVLLFNNNESVFKVENILNLDDKKPLKLAINFGGGRGTFYTNLKTKEIIQQAEGFGELFLIHDNMDSYDWEITGKIKTINNYLCNQAISIIKVVRKDKEITIKVEAWFTDEIPYGFGPIGYGNLSGLIVKLKLPNGFQFVLEKINLKKRGNNIKKPDKGIEISKTDFNNLGRKVMKRY